MAKPKNKLEYLRKINFLSQKDVAAQLKITQQYYGRLEKKPTTISLEFALKLKQIFNVKTIDELLDQAS